MTGDRAVVAHRMTGDRAVAAYRMTGDRAAGALAVALACATLLACKKSEPRRYPHRPITDGPARVWAIDDGERIARKAGALPFMDGRDNPVWSPGAPIRLIGLPGETIAFQVAITAGAEPLAGATVELDALIGPRTLANAPGEAGQTPASRARQFRVIERFVVAELPIKRPSGGKYAGESLAWLASSRPYRLASGGLLPDPLIPIEVAPAWADYPMTVSPGEHRVVWIDVTLPDDAPAGRYRGDVRVTAGAVRDTLPIELDVGPTRLPYAAARTVVFFEPTEEIVARTGSRASVAHFQQLMHRHHIATMFPIRSAEAVIEHRDALTGALFTESHGYAGPGAGVGSDIAIVGLYGGLGPPTPDSLATADEILAALETLGIRDRPGQRDVFLYAVDEQCDSPLGPDWRAALAASGSPRLRGLRVGHTCDAPPASQPVDLVMMTSPHYDPAAVSDARAAGKRVWVYNGQLPHAGAFATDAWGMSLRANGWIQARYHIERWMYWEATFWNDSNPGGHGPYDPLATAETFHNQHGDHVNGDGVLVYPGIQRGDGAWRSLGLDGVVPSIRLKQWRRGISDAGYLVLARAIDAERADAVAARVIPIALSSAPRRRLPPWPIVGQPYFEARRALFELIRQAR